MKHLITVTVALALAACGGGGASPAVPLPLPVLPAIGPAVFIGDSITYHWDAVSWTAGPDLLSSHLPDSIDQGISGQVCYQMSLRFKTDVLAYKPSVVHILCGTNDTFYGAEGSNAIAYLFDMVQAAQAASVPVIVGTIPPDDGRAVPTVHAAWNAEVRAGALTYGYAIAEYESALERPDGSQNMALFAADGVHPNSAGYAVMWTVLAPLLAGEGQ